MNYEQVVLFGRRECSSNYFFFFFFSVEAVQLSVNSLKRMETKKRKGFASWWAGKRKEVHLSPLLGKPAKQALECSGLFLRNERNDPWGSFPSSLCPRKREICHEQQNKSTDKGRGMEAQKKGSIMTGSAMPKEGRQAWKFDTIHWLLILSFTWQWR